MFATHQPKISEYARACPENFAKVGTFVIATVRQPLESAIEDTARYLETGDHSPFWGWKLAAVGELERNAVERLETLELMSGDPDAQLAYVAGWQGFGLVKGGFLLQLAYGVSGCLDSHNMTRLGINPRAFAACRFKTLKRERSRRNLVRAYHEEIERAGGTAALWDDWCDYVAELRPEVWPSGCEVSAAHAMAYIPGLNEPIQEIPF